MIFANAFKFGQNGTYHFGTVGWQIERDFKAILVQNAAKCYQFLNHIQTVKENRDLKSSSGKPYRFNKQLEQSIF